MNYYTETTNFYGNSDPQQLVDRYGSPLYVYNETVLRVRCRQMKELIAYPDFQVNYSVKANSNLKLLQIIHSEGLFADAMSPGEIYVLQTAGFTADEIFYVGNNVSDEEMQYAVEREIIVSVDSLAQLERYGRLNPGKAVAVRFNPGVGAGHHEKVITGGSKTKFGVNPEYIAEVKQILARYQLKLAGINQHIGSLFLEGEPYLAGARALLKIASQFDDLQFVDLGGGFGIPYRKQDGQPRLNLRQLGDELSTMIDNWTAEYGKNIRFKIEPGRYLVAECGVLLGTVHALKENTGKFYVGTDLGFNVLMRPVLYDAYHELEVYHEGKLVTTEASQTATIVGNICETGDIIAKDRTLPHIFEGDLLGVMDAGAYGFSMSSNYNNRLRPAEILIRTDGNPELIRRRESLEDLLLGYES
ncbi:MAG TPA: diaminopimelate decarboxylase [Bacillota bacterium]|nr:diaminopimelate decarboxylase [Bacillota bacterium]